MSQPERIASDDLEAAAEWDNAFEGNSDDVVDMAVQEMGKRLRDGPDEIPAHVLIKLVDAANKTAERRLAAAEAAKHNEAQRDEVEVILSSPLPSEKKRELLEAALSRLDKRVAQLRELLQRGDV